MITVGQLIELLKTFPQDIPVAAWDSSETVDWITSKTLILCQDRNPFALDDPSSNEYTYGGPFLLFDEFDVADLRKE